ncbi:MAG: hypothetical protein K2X49_22610 [Acetobacteraceae bacterium]|nr:hypothetical protein [Acetobacteraceae bacterium]
MANTGLAEAVSRFGRAAKAKLANRAISGAPEDQLRSPLETLIEDLAALAGHAPGSVTPVGGKAFPHRQVSLAAECGQILSGPQARRVLPI